MVMNASKSVNQAFDIGITIRTRRYTVLVRLTQPNLLVILQENYCNSAIVRMIILFFSREQ